VPTGLTRVVVAVAFLAACGKKADPAQKKDAGAGIPGVAPIAMPALGVDRVTRFQFIWGEGSKAYGVCAAKAEAKDWAAARTACESALQKDPWNLDAHRTLAGALAQLGEHAAAVDHLALALAGDYYKYGPSLASPDLDQFRGTPHGQSIAVLAQQIHDEYGKRIKTGLVLLGRRSRSQLPDKTGLQVASTHAELYAYDRDSKRYLRLTHTDHQAAAFVYAPSGNEVAVLGFDKVEVGKSGDAPDLARAWVLAIDTTEWKPAGPKVMLPPAREVSVGYGAGDQLLVSTAPAATRWTLGDVTVSSVDRSTGKLTKVGEPPPVPRVVFNLDEGRVVRGVPGVEAAWSNDPPTTTRLKLAGGAAIAVPESGQAQQSTVAVAPGGARLAFATAVDPCAKDAAPSLYVADTKSGALKHLLTARSRFATRWLDEHVLAYEDGDGAIRLWDAQTGREALRLDDKGGLALDVLPFTNTPVCKQGTPEAGSGAGSDELPPEEGAGPVTAPQ
jgi:hypothetical protein